MSQLWKNVKNGTKFCSFCGEQIQETVDPVICCQNCGNKQLKSQGLYCAECGSLIIKTKTNKVKNQINKSLLENKPLLVKISNITSYVLYALLVISIFLPFFKITEIAFGNSTSDGFGVFNLIGSIFGAPITLFSIFTLQGTELVLMAVCGWIYIGIIVLLTISIVKEIKGEINKNKKITIWSKIILVGLSLILLIAYLIFKAGLIANTGIDNFTFFSGSIIMLIASVLLLGKTFFDAKLNNKNIGSLFIINEKFKQKMF